MSYPLPDVPDSGKITDGNDRITEDRSRINDLNTRLKAVESDIAAATPNAVAGALVRYNGNLANGLAIIQVGNPPTGSTQAASKAYVDSKISTWNGGTVTGQIYLPNATPASSNYVVAYLNGDGRISRGASARRFKQDIRDADVSDAVDRVAALRLRVFKWNPDALEVDPADADRDQVGLIAEEVAELFPWLVVRDPETGELESVHYERLALALLPVVQALIARGLPGQ